MTMINLGNGKYRPSEEIEEAFEKAKEYDNFKKFNKIEDMFEFMNTFNKYKEDKEDLRKECNFIHLEHANLKQKLSKIEELAYKESENGMRVKLRAIIKK